MRELAKKGPNGPRMAEKGVVGVRTERDGASPWPPPHSLLGHSGPVLGLFWPNEYTGKTACGPFYDLAESKGARTGQKGRNGPRTAEKGVVGVRTERRRKPLAPPHPRHSGPFWAILCHLLAYGVHGQKTACDPSTT